jgi:hypothetical protein
MKKDKCPNCYMPKDTRSALCQICRIATYGVDDKICTKCRHKLPISQFRIRTRKNPRPRSVCRTCEAQTQKEYQSRTNKASTRKWEKKNPQRHREATWRRRIKNLGLQDKTEIIISLLHQVKNCQICGVSLSDAGYKHKHTLCIDHCHKTGVFRGLLCSRCNQGIGVFLDNPITLRAAADYLTKTSYTLDQSQVYN